MFDHDKKKQMVSRATDMTIEAREASERCRDYYDSYQWTTEEQAILKRRGQPINIDNRIKRKIDSMIGLEQRGRVDPAAYPRNPGDEDAADIATKCLRYVEEAEALDMKRSAAFENLLIEGYGGVEVVPEQTRKGIEVRVRRLRWEDIFYDPYSREKDFSDAGYTGIQKWMSEDKAKQFCAPFWDGSEEDLDALLTSQTETIGDTYEDRPQDMRMAWVDRRLRRVRVVQMYYLYGDEWRMAVFAGNGDIYDEPSHVPDEDGKPANAMLLMSAYVDRENDRYGMVTDLISMQDEINKRRSKALHHLSSRQTFGMRGAVSSVAAMKRELARPDGHVEINMEEAPEGSRLRDVFDFVPQGDQAMGQLELLAEAKQSIDMTGPNASLMGQLDGQHSGRAIMAQQQAGLAELAPLYDSLRDWTERVYRRMWACIQKYWTDERYIRVTDDQDAPKFVPINRPVMTMQGPMIQNPVGQIDVDIIVTTAPEYITLRSEQFDKMVDLAKSGMVQIPPDVLIEMSDLRDKKKLREMMQGDPQQAQIQAQLAQRDQVAEVEGKEAIRDRNRAAAAKDMASIPLEQAKVAAQQQDAGTKARLAAVDSVTKRISALRTSAA